MKLTNSGLEFSHLKWVLEINVQKLIMPKHQISALV